MAQRGFVLLTFGQIADVGNGVVLIAIHPVSQRQVDGQTVTILVGQVQVYAPWCAGLRVTKVPVHGLGIIPTSGWRQEYVHALTLKFIGVVTRECFHGRVGHEDAALAVDPQYAVRSGIEGHLLAQVLPLNYFQGPAHGFVEGGFEQKQIRCNFVNMPHGVGKVHVDDANLRKEQFGYGRQCSGEFEHRQRFTDQVLTALP